jgi:hypothetical protein
VNHIHSPSVYCFFADAQPAQDPQAPQEAQLQPQEDLPAFLSRTMPRTMKKTDAATAAIRRMLT